MSKLGVKRGPNRRLPTPVRGFPMGAISQRFENSSLYSPTLIRLPNSMAYLDKLIPQTEEQLLQKLGRYPKDTELCEQAGISIYTLNAYRLTTTEYVPLTFATPDEDVPDTDNTLDPTDIAFRVEIRTLIRAILYKLPTRWRLILSYRYGIGHPHSHTLLETAIAFGVTAPAIREIENRALRKLRYRVNRALREYASYD
jgi:DNA-directed RNA polymerase sigma subunit (sigma70/sigma32)